MTDRTAPADASAVGARTLEAGLAAIADVGRAPAGGYARFAWTDVDLTLRAWFRAEAEARGLDVAADRAGNLWAWWGDPDRDGPGVVTGSHLDSVPGGGAFDGPLGVVSAFAAVDVLRAQGLVPRRPLGVVCFGDEEGARFGVACLGSRVLTGALDPARALGLRDDAGRPLAEVLTRVGTAAGAPDVRTYGADDEALARVGTFVELHVEQGRLLSEHDARHGTDHAVAVGSGIWPHGRWRVDLPGRPNHAGTTPLGDRHDPMLDLADLVRDVRAAAERAGALATVGKVVVEPNGVNAIPSRVTAWVDARADDEAAVRAALAHLARFAPQEESWTPATVFDASLALRVADVAGAAPAPGTGATPGDAVPTRHAPGRPTLPLLGTGAGHDAGVLSTAGVSTAMLFVRNPTGVSHAPDEHADPDDCAAGVVALAAVLADLTGAVPVGGPT